jgi:FKBP-type peptidyl-prolyl cis-trans isomerase FkpA
MKKAITIQKRTSLISTIILGAILASGVSSCNYEKKLREEEEELIRSYVETNNITVEPTATGLYYIETLAGEGPLPVDGDTVGVYYRTKFLNGYVLDQLLEGTPYKFVIGNYESIPGFEEGVMLMRLNGKATLLVPSSLAYGSMGYLAVPGYTPLLFEVELVTLEHGPTK